VTSLPDGVSVVCPTYNNEASLPQLVERLHRTLGALSRPHEIVLVNDGSRDRTWDVVSAICATDPLVVGICLSRNYGQHNALLCGIRRARYRTTVTIDDDLQNPPEEIPTLLEALGDECDVVYGTPGSERHGLWRNLASQVTKIALQDVMGASVARQVSAFRVLRTDVREAFAEYRAPYVSIDVLLTWGTNRFKAIPVSHEPRTIGTSNYTFRTLTTHALNMMTGFSVRPLQLASMIGFAFTIFGTCALAYVIGRYLLQGGSVPGFAFLASTVAIFSGAQLFSLGIIGEYIARIHLRTMDRPPYAVREMRGTG
jgi:glycosyltransferase involved in cell wall biosynthesis